MDKLNYRSPIHAFSYPSKFMNVDLGKLWDLFDLLVEQHGYRCQVTPVAICPCLEDDRIPDRKCPKCFGRGRFWDAVKTVEVKAVVSYITKEIREIEPGLFDQGGAMMTFHSSTNITRWDRVTLADVNTQLYESRRAVNGQITAGNLVHEIVSAYERDGATKKVSEIAPDQFKIDGSTSFGVMPKYEGKQISFRYKGSPTYYVMRMDHEYRGRLLSFRVEGVKWKELPTSAFCQRGDFIQTDEVITPNEG